MRFSLSVYYVSLVFITFFSYLFIDPNLSYLNSLYSGYYLEYKTYTALIYFILITVLFSSFIFIINHKNIYKLPIKKLIVLSIVILFLAFPALLSYDIFNYITTAKVTFFYLENPYIIFPNEFVGDSYLEFTRATNKTALYGPVWIGLSSIPHILGLGNFLITLFSFKAFIVAFYIGTVFLISRLDKKAVIFFALNPLVVIEVLVSSHNDIVMMFFAILAFYLIKKRKLVSIFSIIGSIFIKFATIFLIPVYILSFFNKIDHNNVFKYAAISMFIVFLLSPLREELYPWYAIWFLPFTALLYKNKFLQNLIVMFCFGLMLRYLPFMATGNYFGDTPMYRIILTILPVIIFIFYVFYNKRIKIIK